MLGTILDGGFLYGVGAEATLANELRWWLVIYRGEGGELIQEFIEQRNREIIDIARDGRLFRKDNVFGGIRVACIG